MVRAMLRSCLTPALAALIAAAPAGFAQEAGDDTAEPAPGFSILAEDNDPAPETGAQDDNGQTDALADAPASAPAGTGLAMPAGPLPASAFLTRSAYMDARGERLARTVETQWDVERFSLDGESLGSETRTVVIGDGYVHEPGAEGEAVYDFATGRILTRTETLDGPVMRNLPIVAHVHRQMNTFAYFTEGGELDEVAGPGGSLFERFWIEAAMGVRLAEADLLSSENEETGAVQIRRSELGSVIFGWTPGATGTADDAALFAGWLRHAVPIHPDALASLGQAEALPQRFAYLVFSPNSPDGRREVWTRTDESEASAPFPWPDTVAAAGADAYEVADPALTRLLASGFGAVNAPGAAAPDEDAFVAAADAAQNRADLAGAWLALTQAANHFGPCPAQSDRASCQRLSRVVAAGLGNDGFESLVAALGRASEDRAAALDILRGHLHRDGLAGGAANLIAAQSIAALESEGSEAATDLSALTLFADAAERDPFAPMTYWHAGRYAAALGELDTAWLLFDIARTLSDGTALPPAREGAAMSGQLRSLAPQFFGPAAAD